MRIATWNIERAFNRVQLDDQWRWAAENLDADCVVFTEAKVPDSGVPDGWTAVWDPAGVYPDSRNRWGTVIAGRGVELRPVTSMKRFFRRVPIAVEWPAAVQVVEVWKNGEFWATVVGFYAVTKDENGEKNGSGRYSWPTMMDELAPLLCSRTKQRLIIAGDMNLHPPQIRRVAEDYRLVDLIEHTGHSRELTRSCISCRKKDGCHHVWTHKNRGGPNPSVQQIDFILASESLTKDLVSVRGGDEDFPAAWDLSDHTPVVAEFRW
jgi:exonuclease III